MTSSDDHHVEGLASDAKAMTSSPLQEVFLETSPSNSAGPSAAASPTTAAFEPPPAPAPPLTTSELLQARRMSRRHATETSLNTAYLGAVIPPRTPNRTLVLCFDGTGDQFDNDNSNIVQLFSLLKKGDKDQQLCYYQARILNSLLIT